jgi:hypothetical protein
MHRARIEKQSECEKEYQGGKAKGEGVSHDLHSVRQQEVVDRCNYYRQKRGEEHPYGETPPEQQKQRTDDSAPNADGPGGNHPGRETVEERELLVGKLAHIRFILRLRHDEVQRTHRAPQQCENADCPEMPGRACGSCRLRVSHNFLLMSILLNT